MGARFALFQSSGRRRQWVNLVFCFRFLGTDRVFLPVLAGEVGGSSMAVFPLGSEIEPRPDAVFLFEKRRKTDINRDLFKINNFFVLENETLIFPIRQ